MTIDTNDPAELASAIEATASTMYREFIVARADLWPVERITKLRAVAQAFEVLWNELNDAYAAAETARIEAQARLRVAETV